MLFSKAASSCPASHLASSRPAGSFSSPLFSAETPFRSRWTINPPVVGPPPRPSWNWGEARNSSSPSVAGAASASYFSPASDLELDFEEDEGSPWEGAVVYRRDPSVTHLEYCTTLERLGLGKLSSELSVTWEPSLSGTPVLISIDVTRKKRKLKLDGILRTVIVLGCNRCGGPAAENVFSNFALLLTEDPIAEPEEFDLGTIYGTEKSRGFSMGGEDEDEDEESIDLDDRLYFPSDEKAIDISKNIRDIVHLEITINAVCDPSCKGLCLKVRDESEQEHMQM
ncbi:unnamed protein product [Spirodela intermedia]|uniref:Uncharacterized protein n=1 Tax=Spirodela intermedia TaxID=51605 RepID=A0A7I8IEI0_SPIIN|nr:unnamed protein product [Spirodela intermedia]CAA6655794.1 unnamed protein product [Spirodela intermedia]